MDTGGVFLGRDAFDFARINLRNAAGSFGFPRPCQRRLYAAVPCDHDAIDQFRHDLNWHLAGFVNDLIQCHRHEPNLAHVVRFDNPEAEAEEKTSEMVIQKIFDELPVWL